MAVETATPRSAWSPLAHPIFRALWLAALVSNVGTLMQGVGAAWLMTSLTKSPVPVALLTTAASLPLFLVGLPAGALADVVDRRWLLIVTQMWMLLAAAIMSFLDWFGLMAALESADAHFPAGYRRRPERPCLASGRAGARRQGRSAAGRGAEQRGL